MRILFNKYNNIFFFFLIVTFLLYGNTLRNKYALDDDYVTVTNFPVKGNEYFPNNKLVAKGIKGIPKIWKSRYATDNESSFDYRPVTTSSFAIEYSVFGQNPFMSHLINIILYFLCIWVLFCVLYKLFEAYKFNFIVSFLVAFVFLIHPIHTEVVASIKCRDELFAFLFPIISLWYCLLFYQKSTLKNAVLILLFLLLGMLSKRSAIVFIAIIPLCIIFYREVKIKMILYFCVFVVILAALNGVIRSIFLPEKSVRIFYHFENPLYTESLSFFGKIIVGLKTFGFYLKFLMFPFPFRFYYGGNMIDMSSSIDSYLIIGILFLIGGVVYYFKSKNKLFLFSFLLFLGSVFPFVNFAIPVAGVVGERLVFQASVGFCLLLITLLMPFIPVISEFKLKQLITKPFIYSLPILISCVFYIWNRNAQWYNKLSLFEHDISYTENSAKANSMLANEYFEMLTGTSTEKKYSSEVLAQKAIKYYNAAVASDSSFFTAYNNAGVIFFSNLNDIASAKHYFSLAIHHKDKYAQAYENLGNCYKKECNLKEAFKYYTLAIESNNKHYSGYTALLGLLIDKKQYALSAKISQMALTVFPSDYYLLIYLANSYLLGNEKEKAFTVFEEAYLINPTNELRQFLDKEKLNK
jgi:hypothetical protein